jgi:hypothetical protein
MFDPSSGGTPPGGGSGWLDSGTPISSPSEIPEAVVALFEQMLEDLEGDEDFSNAVDAALEDGVLTPEEEVSLFESAWDTLFGDDIQGVEDYFENIIERLYISYNGPTALSFDGGSGVFG